MTDHEDAYRPPADRPPQGAPYSPPAGVFGPPEPYAAPSGAFGPPQAVPSPRSPYGPPPQYPYGPPQYGPGQPPPARRRKRLLLFGGVGVLAAGLVAGLLVWHGGGAGSDEPVAKRDLAPFRQAVAALADAPGLRYRDSGDDPVKRDITVTASGSRFGAVEAGSSGLAREVLHIGGRTFTRAKDSVSGAWAAADESDSVTRETVGHMPAPPDLATALAKALDRLEGTPAPSGSAPPPAVDGTPALAVDTSAGRLLVTKRKPHRVLRLESYGAARPGGSSGGSADAAPVRLTTVTARAGSEDDDPPEIPELTDGPLAESDSEGLDLAPVAEDAVDPMFDTLEKQTEELKNATDSGINLTLSSGGTVKCGSGGCTAKNSFSGHITTSARSRLVSGKVTAVMTASFSIDGRSAGRCTSPQSSFAVSGTSVSGSLSCSNPGAGPTFSSVEAQKKNEARARSRASGGRLVQYRIPYRADTLINAYALARTEVKKLVDRVRQERDAGGCAPRASASGATARSGGVTVPAGLFHSTAVAHHNPSAWAGFLAGAKCPDAKAVKAAETVIDRAGDGKVRKSSNYHPHFSDERVAEILKAPDAVYLSQGQRGNLIFRKGEDIVVTKGPGAGAGDVITGYGPSGKKGESGAKALGGSPDDPQPPVTHEDIVNGQIRDTKGGHLPAARRIK
ncbi:hypothetical protein [Streptomyces sp. CB02460]|uniref:hypothetical protein n=1 Tax=Streptomyces sp. CB02460 TaxID=1703941 RepID=UPI000967D224|nr:hypothetical protein [Streptomyces sp. CB02460]OKJ72812.1 hypothetical protein AMK30_17795 [Streptomyces sp. CB02460]